MGEQRVEERTTAGGPRSWVLIAGGLAALAWPVLIISMFMASTVGIVIGLVLMVSGAVWWRIQMGSQIDAKLRSRLERRADKWSKDSKSKTGFLVKSWIWKNLLLAGAVIRRGSYRPILAAVRELRVVRTAGSG